MKKNNILDEITNDLNELRKSGNYSSKNIEIIKYNKLIAKFIGDKKFWLLLERLEGIYPNFNGTYYQSGDDRTIDNPLKEEDVIQHKACFHYSWDWLMPAVAKAIKLAEEKNIDYDKSILKKSLCTAKIDIVYIAVLHFIKWYNEKLKTL